MASEADEHIWMIDQRRHSTSVRGEISCWLQDSIQAPSLFVAKYI